MNAMTYISGRQSACDCRAWRVAANCSSRLRANGSTARIAPSTPIAISKDHRRLVLKRTNLVALDGANRYFERDTGGRAETLQQWEEVMATEPSNVPSGPRYRLRSRLLHHRRIAKSISAMMFGFSCLRRKNSLAEPKPCHHLQHAFLRYILGADAAAWAASN
jgi:hypothetical protein